MRSLHVVLSVFALGLGAPHSLLAQDGLPDASTPVLQVQSKQSEERKQQEETRKAIREAQEAIRQAARQTSAVGVAIPAHLATLKGVPGVDGLFAASEAKISVDFDNVPLREALRKLFADAKADYDVEDGASTDARVFLKAKNIRLASALQALTDQANVRWTTVWKVREEEMKFRASYRILPAIQFASFPAPPASIFSPRVPSAATDVPQPPYRPGTFVINTPELRQTFHCPHCGGEITTVKPQKRSRSRAQWKFCPLCGKQVDMEEDGEEDHASIEIGRLEPGAQVKIVVFTPDERLYNRTCTIDATGQLRLGVHQIVINVAGCTTGKLEQVLAAKLRYYWNDPKVSATIVSKK
jgi:predicted RNA-binding Zn-ribbon protein involved in translation (DUF1610 family)